MPLSFVSQNPRVGYVNNGRSQANKGSTESKHGATGDNYPTHNRPYCRAVARLDSRKSRNSFPGIENIDWDSRVLLTSQGRTHDDSIYQASIALCGKNSKSVQRAIILSCVILWKELRLCTTHVKVSLCTAMLYHCSIVTYHTRSSATSQTRWHAH